MFYNFLELAKGVALSSEFRHLIPYSIINNYKSENRPYAGNKRNLNVICIMKMIIVLTKDRR